MCNASHVVTSRKRNRRHSRCQRSPETALQALLKKYAGKTTQRAQLIKEVSEGLGLNLGERHMDRRIANMLEGAGVTKKHDGDIPVYTVPPQ